MMSETFDEQGAAGLDEPGLDELDSGYDVGVEGGDLDPFSENFGQQIGDQVHQAVQDGVAAALGLPQQAPEYPYPYPEPQAPELSDEDVAAANANIDAGFDALAEHHGVDFDREEAFNVTLDEFTRLTDAGMPVEEAVSQAIVAGAADAAATARGEPLVERVVAAELARVGPNVNKGQIRAAAEEFMPRA